MGTYGGLVNNLGTCGVGVRVTVLLISIPDLHLALGYPRW